MTPETDLEKKEHRYHILVPRWIVGLVGALVVLFLTVTWLHSQERPVPQTLTAQKLVLVDDQGHPRMILAAPLPGPQVGGKQYPRSRNVYGFQFLDPAGNEVGGLGMTDDPEQRILCFDWATAEAVCISRYPHGAAISFQDEPKPDAPVGRSGPTRIRIRLDKGEARIALADESGKERIALTTGPGNQAALKVTDENGKPIFQVPQP